MVILAQFASKTADYEWSRLADDLGSAQLWQWSVALGLLIVAWVIGVLVSALLRRQSRRFRQAEKSSPLRAAYPLLAIVLNAVSSPLTVFLLAIALLAGTYTILGEWKDYSLLNAWRSVLLALMTMAVGWFVYRLVAVVEYIVGLHVKRSDKLMGNSYLVPLIRKTLKTLVVIGVFFFIAQNILMWNVSAALTALGLGGLAFALAAQPTLSNLFGSLMIYTDKPFLASETIKFRAYTGIVQDVGFRSTRIRTVDGTVVTIPNSAIANEPVETLGYCPGLRQDFAVALKNNPPAEKTSIDLAEAATKTIQDILDERKASLLTYPAPRVALSAVAAGTLTVSAQYWFATWDARELALFQHELLMDILRRLRAAGLELA